MQPKEADEADKEAAMKRVQQRLQTILRQAQLGEAATFEFTVMIVPMMILILLIGMITIYWGTRMPARRAASDCARAAIATLDAPTGIAQGRAIAQESLKGNNMNADSFHIDIFGDWSPGGKVTCTVRFRILLPNDSTPQTNLGSAETWFDINNVITLIDDKALVVIEGVTLEVEPFKSEWK